MGKRCRFYSKREFLSIFLIRAYFCTIIYLVLPPPLVATIFKGKNFNKLKKQTFFPRITMAGPLYTPPRTGPSVKHVNCWWKAQLIWRLKTVLDKLRLMLLIPMFSGLWPDLSCPFLSQPVLLPCPILSHDNFLLSCLIK